MAYTAVGTDTSTAVSTVQATVSVVTTNLGDLAVMFVLLAPAPGFFVTGITGGGCGTWTQAGPSVSMANASLQEWYSTVTTVGTANATLTFGGSIGSTNRVAACQKFSAGLGAKTIWAVDTANAVSHTASATITYPTLTPSSGTELYVGFSHAISTQTAGTTTGYTYEGAASSFELLTYNLAVSAASTPTSTQATSGLYVTAAALFKASVPASPAFLPFFM